MAELHGGTLVVESEGEALGCVFTLRLPLETQHETTQASVSRSTRFLRGRYRPRVNMSRRKVAVEDSGKDSGKLPRLSTRKMLVSSVQLVAEKKHSDAVLGESDKWEEVVPFSLDIIADVALCVDDAPLNLRMMCRMVKSKFRELVEAENGYVAVLKLSELMSAGKTVDVVLMDYMMPVMNGPTAAREMRNIGYKGLIIGML